MALRQYATTLVGSAAALAVLASGAVRAGQDPTAPLSVSAAQVTLSGTSNIHAYTASTRTVRVTRAQIASQVPGPAFWEHLVVPGGLEAFEIAIPVATLTSPKDGLDKNMHKALKAKEHADIIFQLRRIEPRTGHAGALRAVGALRIAGVEREVALDIATARTGSSLTVKGEIRLLMTDFGITPPKAMLGMLKTDPKVTVSFETTLAIPLT